MLSLIVLLSGVAMAEDLWTTDAVAMKRWPGAAVDNPVVKNVPEGTTVEVVLRDGDLVRVRVGGDLGWVAADMLTDEAPAIPEPTGGLLDGIGGLGGGPGGGLPPISFGGGGLPPITVPPSDTSSTPPASEAAPPPEAPSE